MKLKIKGCSIIKWTYWNKLMIDKIALYDNDWKYVKFVKLSDFLVDNISNFDLVLPVEHLLLKETFFSELKS